MRRAIAGLALALMLGAAQAATHYIRDGGTASTAGTGSCTGWATANACDQFPATLVRGDTYCVADGSYTTPSFATAESGSSVITIRKAVDGDGVCDQGANWLSTYGDGQATLNGGATFQTGYWTIDGRVRNESNPPLSWQTGSAYGFRLVGAVFASRLSFGVCADNITLAYTDIGPDDGTSNIESYSGATIYAGGFASDSTVCENWQIRRNKIHNGRTMGQMAGVHNFTWEYNWLQYSWEKSGIRHQIRGSSMTYRYNVFFNVCLGNGFDPGSGENNCTAIIGWYGNAGSNGENYTNSAVYGNLIINTLSTRYSDAVIWMGDDRTSQGGGLQDCTGCVIYNNTFVGMDDPSGSVTLKFTGITTNTAARNNVWYDVGTNNPGCQAATCSNNFKITDSGVFQSAAANDFRLTSDGAAGAGVALSSPYTSDMLGTARGTGTWDVGAYEYDEGGAGPEAPKNFRLVSFAGWALLAGLLGGTLWRMRHGATAGCGGRGAARVRHRGVGGPARDGMAGA